MREVFYLRKMQSAARRAITDFNLIEDNDAVAVGVSGGKDSLTLLYVLAAMRVYMPQKFTVKALMLDLGYKCDTSEFERFCEKIDVECIIKQTDVANVVFDVRHEKNPCSLCAKMRRGALNELAVESGCNKVALGHHFDDVIETFYMSLIYEARLSCFDAKSYLDRVGVTVIRPLIYIEEKDIINFAEREKLPIIHNPCPADGFTKRQYVKNLLADLERDNPDVKHRIFRAVREGLLLKK